MKKCCLVLLTGVLLSMMLCAPAMATTGIAVDDKTYVIYGDQSTFEADGKTFIIGEDSVRIQEAGNPDLVLPLVESVDSSAVIVDTTAGNSATASETGSAFSGGTVAIITGESPTITNNAAALQSDQFNRYAKFGLYDTAEGILYYQGQRVRIFEDSYSLGDNTSISIEYFDAMGVVDVEAQRYLSIDNTGGSYDSGGLLTGLRVLSAEEFAARDLTQWTQPRAQQAVASASSEAQRAVTSASSEGFMTIEEKQAFYAPYAELGMTYDAKKDSLIYQGQEVRRFLDIRKSNGEALDSGRFSGTITNLNNDSGTIDVTTIRDYTRPDAEGNGKLVGVRVENAE